MTRGWKRALRIALPVLLLAAHREQAACQSEADVFRQAKELQLNLNYDEAEKRLHDYLQAQPESLPELNLLATVVLYRQMFQRGLLESQLYGNEGDIFTPKQVPLSAEYQQNLNGALDRAEAAAERRLMKNPKDKEAMYWAGVAHGTRATFEFTLRRAWLPALRQAKEATRYHRDLAKLDPTWVDAQFILGINDYVVGSLPWYIKVVAALAGAHGDRAGGLVKVQQVADSGNYAREDARFMLDVLYQREKRFQDAVAVVQPLAQRYPRNFLLQMELAGLYRELKEWGKASDTYEGLLAQYQAGAAPRLPAAKVMWLAGQTQEALGKVDKALEMYERAGKVADGAPFKYRAQLAAAALYIHMNRPEEAKRTYEQVAQATPDSAEGKLAKKALKR